MNLDYYAVFADLIKTNRDHRQELVNTKSGAILASIEFSSKSTVQKAMKKVNFSIYIIWIFHAEFSDEGEEEALIENKEYFNDDDNLSPIHENDYDEKEEESTRFFKALNLISPTEDACRTSIFSYNYHHKYQQSPLPFFLKQKA